MTRPYLDTDIIIRLLTKDDLAKQAAAAALFEKIKAGSLEVAVLDTVIADAVYVLSSPRLYNLPRAIVRELLTPLVQLTGCRIRNRRAVLRALDLYASLKIDFGGALIAASMEQPVPRLSTPMTAILTESKGLPARRPEAAVKRSAVS
jgi:predicted nucleic-acid-binding protein